MQAWELFSQNLFGIENGWSWRHTDVICSQPIIGSGTIFDTICKRNVREGTESVATIGAVVLEILRKEHKEGAQISPPPTRVRVKPGRLSHVKDSPKSANFNYVFDADLWNNIS